MIHTIDRLFLGSAIVCGIAGMGMGLVMGMSENFSLASAHAHLNLAGWVSLALFGFAYRSGMAVRDRWAVAHFFVAVTGAVLLPVGVALVVLYQQPVIAALGGVLSLASMIMFASNFFRQPRPNTPGV
jgi:hypothetical protein